MFPDSHCHIDFPDYPEGVVPLLDHMQVADVGYALCISVNLEHSPGCWPWPRPTPTSSPP